MKSYFKFHKITHLFSHSRKPENSYLDEYLSDEKESCYYEGGINRLTALERSASGRNYLKRKQERRDREEREASSKFYFGPLKLHIKKAQKLLEAQNRSIDSILTPGDNRSVRFVEEDNQPTTKIVSPLHGFYYVDVSGNAEEDLKSEFESDFDSIAETLPEYKFTDEEQLAREQNDPEKQEVAPNGQTFKDRMALARQKLRYFMNPAIQDRFNEKICDNQKNSFSESTRETSRNTSSPQRRNELDNSGDDIAFNGILNIPVNWVPSSDNPFNLISDLDSVNCPVTIVSLSDDTITGGTSSLYSAITDFDDYNTGAEDHLSLSNYEVEPLTVPAVPYEGFELIDNDYYSDFTLADDEDSIYGDKVNEQ